MERQSSRLVAKVDLTTCSFRSPDVVTIAHQGSQVVAVLMVEAGKTKAELLPNFFGEFLLQQGENSVAERCWNAEAIRGAIRFANKNWHSPLSGFSHVRALERYSPPSK